MANSSQWHLGETDKGREYWLSRPYVDATIRPALERASILLVPEEGFRDTSDPLFHQGSLEFMKFLRGGGLQVDICIRDEDYRELSLNFDLITLGGIIVAQLALPILVNLVSEYIKQRAERAHRSSDNLQVRLFIEAIDGDKSRVLDFRYSGPAKELASALNQAGVTMQLEGEHKHSVDGD